VTPVWVLIAVLAVATATMKAVGPTMLGSRRPSERASAVIRLLPPALLGGLVVYETLGSTAGPGLSLDARLAALGVALAALALRLPLLVVVAAAAAATALTRLLL
jgi:branched-subunit amino acid transport protein AzlD